CFRISMPSIPGIFISSSTSSGRFTLKISNASRPLAADNVSNPSLEKTSSNNIRIPGWSSTIKIVFKMNFLLIVHSDVSVIILHEVTDLKILSTQLTGLFQDIAGHDDTIEDIARL